jgi:hypothetical protein
MRLAYFADHASPSHTMQTPFGDVYACTLPNVRHIDVLRIRTSDFWKKSGDNRCIGAS